MLAGILCNLPLPGAFAEDKTAQPYARVEQKKWLRERLNETPLRDEIAKLEAVSEPEAERVIEAVSEVVADRPITPAFPFEEISALIELLQWHLSIAEERAAYDAAREAALRQALEFELLRRLDDEEAILVLMLS